VHASGVSGHHLQKKVVKIVQFYGFAASRIAAVFPNSDEGGTMNSLILILMMQLPTATTQFLVSTKAGLVNYVQGSATVKPATSIPPGKEVRTGPDGAVEILLNPGSFLRMGGDSRVVLERVLLDEITIRILEGSMVITANGFNKDLPLTVNTGDLKMEIIKDGIYLFADGRVVVVDGRIRDASNGLMYSKGYQISNDQGYRAQKVKTFTTALELWSQKRDAQIAQANLNVAKSLRQTQNLPLYSLLDVWLWYPAFGSFVYMPGSRYRSPYGYRYQTAGEPSGYGGYGGGGGGGYSGGGGGGSANGGRGPINAETSSATSGNGGGGGGGGGFSGGGGGAPSVAPSATVGPSPGAQSPHQGAPRQSVAP